MSKSEVKCENPKCGKIFLKENGEINRSKRIGRKQYCSMSCYSAHEGKHYLKRVSEENVKRLRENIKNYAGNQRDEFTPFRYFRKVMNNRNRRKQRTGDFDLQYLKDLWDEQKGVCPLTGWKLELPISIVGFDENTKKSKRASVDRIDNSRGYEKGNIRFISYMGNIALGNMTDAELFEFCKAVAENN